MESASARLAEWKAFRARIGELTFEESLKQTTHLWSYAPFVDHYLDRVPPEEWPTPWELVAGGKFDELTKSLCMLYTLYLSSHGKDHTFSLLAVSRSTALEQYYIVDIDSGKYILSYEFDAVITNIQLDSDVSIIRRYSSEDLQLQKYQ